MHVGTTGQESSGGETVQGPILVVWNCRRRKVWRTGSSQAPGGEVLKLRCKHRHSKGYLHPVISLFEQPVSLFQTLSLTGFYLLPTTLLSC